jgi:hypothetical protein
MEGIAWQLSTIAKEKEIQFAMEMNADGMDENYLMSGNWLIQWKRHSQRKLSLLY